MSNKTQGWAWDQQTDKPIDKMVLIALADCAGRDHYSYPSHRELAAMSQCSVDTVQRALKRLEERSLIKSEHRIREHNNGMSSKGYVVLVDGQATARPERWRGGWFSGDENTDQNVAPLPQIAAPPIPQDAVGPTAPVRYPLPQWCGREEEPLLNQTEEPPPPTPATSGTVSKGGGGIVKSEKTKEADLIVDGLHEAGVSATTIEVLLEPLVRRRRIDAPDPLFALLQLGRWVDQFPDKFPLEGLVAARETLLTARRATVKDADITDAVKAACVAALEQAAIVKRTLPPTLAPLPEQTAQVRALLRAKIGDAEYQAWNTDLMVDAVERGDVDTTVRLSVGNAFRARWANQNQAATLIDCCAAVIPGTTMIRVGTHNHQGA